jgi:hypothetical protein
LTVITRSNVSEPIAGGRGHGGDGSGVGDVADHANCLPTRRSDRLDGDGGINDVRYANPSAGGGDRFGVGGADALRGAGHDHRTFSEAISDSHICAAPMLRRIE